MRAIKKYGSFMMILFSAAVLHAQTPAPPPPAPAAPAPAPTAPAPATLTVAEMQARSETLMTQITEDHRQVIYLKELAKKQKDVIKLNCVNDKLVQLKAQMNFADSTNGELQAALTANADTRFDLFVKLSGDREAIRTLKDQATACVGAPELFKQEAGVEVTHPEIIDDPTQQDPFIPDIEVPGYASPFN
jgi:hypothetical protein